MSVVFRVMPLSTVLMLIIALGCRGEPAPESKKTNEANDAPAAGAVVGETQDGASPAQDPPTDDDEPDADARSDSHRSADADLAALLKAAVTRDGAVRYEVLAKSANREKLQSVVKAYGSTELPENRDQRLAIWCNAYNANVLWMALSERSKPGFVNVAKVEGFFDKLPIVVAGEKLTLNALENERVRPLGDARIHAALVCAAQSCPPLRNEPYLAAKLDRQFDEQCRAWVDDLAKNTVVDGGLRISSIFDWYGKDFDAAPYRGVRGFLAKYAEPGGPIDTLLETDPKAKITFADYDWALNQAP